MVEIIIGSDIIELATLIVLIFGFSLGIFTLRVKHQWNLALNAMSYSTIHMDNIMKIRSKLDKQLNLTLNTDIISSDKINELIDTKVIEKPDLTLFLNYYENIAIAYNKKIADKKILFDLFAGGFVKTRIKFSDYILQERKKRNNDRLWINFENLSIEWQRKLSQK